MTTSLCSAPAPQTTFSDMGHTVLAIDDDPNVLEMISFVLRRAGLTVFVASSGTAGMELAILRKPDLILLDLMMPEMDGFDVCRILKDNALTALIPIVMLTAKRKEMDRIISFQLGADDYLPKPIDLRELTLRVASILHVDLGRDRP